MKISYDSEVDAVRRFGDRDTLRQVTFEGLGPAAREQRVG